MANIVEPIVGDRRIQLGNEEFVRTLGVRTNWSKLRIGIRHNVNTTGATILSASFVVGLCEGSAATYYNNNTTGFWGLSICGALTSNWTLSGNFYATSGGNSTFVTRIGNTTNTASNSIGGDTPYVIINPSHGVMYLDLEKNNAGSNRMTHWYMDSTAHNYDHSQTEFFQGMESEFTGGSPNSVPGARNYNGANNYNYAGNINALDPLSISWNKSTPTMEISDIMVLRFS